MLRGAALPQQRQQMAVYQKAAYRGDRCSRRMTREVYDRQYLFLLIR